MLQKRIKIVGLGAISLFLAASPWLRKFLANAQAAPIGVYTQRFDNTRIGVNASESILSPSTVSSATFGKLFTEAVDGEVYAEPLYAPAVSVPGQGVHNLVFVATEHDSLYAFDADTAGAALARTSLIGSGETTVPATDSVCSEITNEIGITGTPAIDPSTNTLYVVARTKLASSPPQYIQRLHALDLGTLAERPNFPVVIAASVPGTGPGSIGGVLSFDPLLNNPRPGLLLSQHGPAGKVLYISWASSCDHGNYHGWVIGYDPISGQQEAVFATTPNGAKGGIWEAGTGPAEDSSGFIYVGIGNGDYNPAIGNYGDSIIKLAPPVPPSTQMQVVDFFTPSYQCALQQVDLDMGSGGPFVLSDQTFSPADLLITGDKVGTIYALNADTLGGGPSPTPCPTGLATPIAAPAECSSNTTIPQCFLDNASTPGKFDGSLTFWNNKLFAVGGKQLPSAFLRSNGGFATTPTDQVVTGNFSIDGPRGLSPVVSSNGNTGGILWVYDDARYNTASPILYAFDASNLQSRLYASNVNPADDPGGVTVKFTVPTVANGKVYIGTQSTLAVYGLLNQPTPTATPTSTASATSTPTATPTATDTPTATATATATDTPTPTATATATATATDTPTPTATATATATATDTPTPTATATATATATDTPTPTATATATATPTAAQTPTATATATPAGVLTLTSSSISFGKIPIGDTSAIKLASVTNTGNASVTFTSIGLSGANAPDFAIVSNGCVSPLKTGIKCSVKMDFVPAGSHGVAENATLTFSDSASNSPQLVALSGTPIVGLADSLAKLSFGTVKVGSTSQTLTETIKNNHAYTVSLSASITGTNATDFTIAAATTCAGSLSPGNSCSYAVAMTPSAKGTRTATLQINDSVDPSLLITLTGSGG